MRLATGDRGFGSRLWSEHLGRARHTRRLRRPAGGGWLPLWRAQRRPTSRALARARPGAHDARLRPSLQRRATPCAAARRLRRARRPAGISTALRSWLARGALQPELGAEHVRMRRTRSRQRVDERVRRLRRRCAAFRASPARGLAERDDYASARLRRPRFGGATRRAGADLARVRSRRRGADDAGRSPRSSRCLPAPPAMSEAEFERRLWLQLQRLHECDDPRGLGPRGQRRSRRSALLLQLRRTRALRRRAAPAAAPGSRGGSRWPALVFNPHAQFERLRRDGHSSGCAIASAQREIALQGTHQSRTSPTSASARRRGSTRGAIRSARMALPVSSTHA